MADTSTTQSRFPTDGHDARFEAKFIEWNLDYRFEPAFPIDQVRVAEWAQVRQVGHIAPEDQVEEYRQQMANGAVFPPVVLMAPETLIDGNTRFRAIKKLHRKTLAVYVVELASVPIAKSLAGALNQMGGKRLTPEEAAEAAKILMSMHFTDEAIAREIGRSVEQVRRLRNQIEFAERSAKLSIEHVAEAISPDNRARLNAVRHDPPFAEMARFVADVNPPKKTVSEVLKQVQEAPSDADAITIIKTAERELRPAGPPPRRVTVSPQVTQMTMHLSGLIKLGTDPMAIFDPREDKREERTEQWRQLGELSRKMLELYSTTPATAERELVTA